jgi:hypothetical protein
MPYGLSLGVTTHLDQGAFQATNTPSDGAAHEDNYTTHRPFLALHDEGRLPARLRINFLHQDTTPDLPSLTERLKHTFKFFGDDIVRTGGIGEFILKRQPAFRLTSGDDCPRRPPFERSAAD